MSVCGSRRAAIAAALGALLTREERPLRDGRGETKFIKNNWKWQKLIESKGVDPS